MAMLRASEGLSRSIMDRNHLYSCQMKSACNAMGTFRIQDAFESKLLMLSSQALDLYSASGNSRNFHCVAGRIIKATYGNMGKFTPRFKVQSRPKDRLQVKMTGT